MSEKSEKAKKEVKKKQKALDDLKTLNGKTFEELNKSEQELVIAAVLTLMNITDENNRINIVDE